MAPDRVPDSRRSLASSVFAVAGPIGAVVGGAVGGVVGAFGAFDAFGCSCVQNCSSTVRRGFSFSLRGVAFCAARGGFWGPDACCLVRFVRCLAAVGGEISAFFMFMHYPSGGGFLMLRVLFGDVVGRFYLIFTDEGFWA